MYRIVFYVGELEVSHEEFKKLRDARHKLEMLRNGYHGEGWTAKKIGKDCLYVWPRVGGNRCKYIIEKG